MQSIIGHSFAKIRILVKWNIFMADKENIDNQSFYKNCKSIA